MLTHSKEGKLCLEDEDGSVELDFSQLVCTLSYSVADIHAYPANRISQVKDCLLRAALP